MLNPLIDEIFELILTKHIWKIHTLALKLSERGVINDLDTDPYRDLFKRNFLIMNALYQLQQQLLPNQYLLVASLHIELTDNPDKITIAAHDSLQAYYLDWQNYDASITAVKSLLDNFWHTFRASPAITTLDQQQRHTLLKRWELPDDFSMQVLQKRWRQLATHYHPDKQHGNAEQFKQLKNEYEQLRASCSKTS
ncbi:DNA-J related domain-containing protein [Pseudoalteromonas arctica]|uniref:DnaJ domain-containing protein n=1 Tax=Pseudoalteromonas arctica TaxID=394751 RepID=A0A7Y0DT32_9GAMM|nr:DNA-J related domain-containing protein [Pseudoalteromonas arctica]NMM41113.1 DnaJ domain-containing protein [Pseudoalteromonas arctica]